MPFRAALDINGISPMSFRCLSLFVALAALAVAAGTAHAVCTATEIVNQEAGCAPGPNCTITKDYVISDACTLDFGTRNVTVADSSHLSVPKGTVTIRAGRLTLGGFIDGLGTGLGARGAMIIIETTGNVDVTAAGRIDLSGNGNGGDLIVRAGGSVSIAGHVQADFLNRAAGGGLIDIAGLGNFTSSGVISAVGGSDSDGGGEIDLSAGGAMILTTDLDVSGLDGGFVTLQAGGALSMHGIEASGGGDAGSGGCIDIGAGGGATITGSIISNGASGTFMSGGCGGLICIDGGFGNMAVTAPALISADGASPDGGGGNITVLTRGNATVNGHISARGPAGETCGGCLCVESGLDTTLFASGGLDVSGGDSGGAAGLLAGRNLVIDGEVDASGQRPGSLGGDVTARAGRFGTGSLTLTNTIDVRSSGSCSEDNGCGEGGTTDLVGCNVTLTAAAALLAGAPDAGENSLTAREQLTVRGIIDASRTIAAGTFGDNRFTYPAGRAPFVLATVNPAALTLALTTCPNQGETIPPCLDPCPVCGNGMVQFPETCDQGAIPPKSCSGCSIYCQIEDCDDGLACTGDSCNPSYGCLNQPTPLCTEPTATATGTPPTPTATPSANSTSTHTPSRTPTGVPSATRTATPTQTRTPSPSPSATLSPSPTRTNTLSSTATATPMVTATPTASTTLTPSPTPSATATATLSVTPTLSATPTLSPDPTATPLACPGDCNGSGDVTVNELIVGVNIALGNTSASSCPAFDRNGDGTVSISELIAAVNAALSSC
jgi:hypothetical protein